MSSSDKVDELSGTIEKTIYQNEETGFSVFVMQFGKDKSTIVRGFMPATTPGQDISVTGLWVMHPKFGRQFEAKTCIASTPTSLIGLKKYLGSGMIKGIGPKYAEKLVDAFGEKTLEIIDKEPHKLNRVEGIGAKRLEQIINGWQDQKSISHVMVFLQEKGVSPAFATKIYKKYGQDAIAIVSENPYRLAEDIWGVGFKTADQIALNMNFTPNSVKRIRAGILYALTEYSSQGHLYCELNTLRATTCTLLDLSETEHASLLKSAFHDLHNEDKIKIVTYEQAHYIALTKHYFTEYGVAKKIAQLQSYPNDIPLDVDAVYQKLRAPKPHEIELNEDQQKGILTCLQNKISVVTGGPGTGKTTLIKKLLEALDDHHISYKLAAPTGRAAKRMSESTGKLACTIHRLLEFDANSFGFSRNEQNTLSLNYLIVDEASMLDIHLMYAILRAVPYNAHIVFIGDIDQLPSVGPGNVLQDILESNKIAHVRLTQIFRQAQNSMIIVNAHRINQGEFPIAPLEGAKKDFIFIKEEDPTNIAKHLENIYLNGFKKFGIAQNDAITLVPMNRGIAGTQKINYDLQQFLNGTRTEEEVTHNGSIFRRNDRVMQIRNNYDKAVFNGDIGVIESIDKTDRILFVLYLDRLVEYEFSELDELSLAYAVSIHKSQGSEFDAVVILVFMQHFMLLRRNLIYTAITRAKKLCIFIGQPKAIAMAINNTKDIKRITFLKQYLISDLKCR
jgi:exodeoxyribonuclease V alpha subunit